MHVAQDEVLGRLVCHTHFALHIEPVRDVWVVPIPNEDAVLGVATVRVARIQHKIATIGL
eukprot:CAMPEP_0202039860 /NCGR_PEP_ID=MMETSP0962-20130828/18252_1 /ASSEMBLY_ACC=CAM_ASM_000488 /TAXON_ID=4773 /ORGANISM="Schizochytrium aggregatum, Strain ATCC28209" /LENGTH=59 /DNA_ID=CAMNT_0048604105 /DNA_START=185 /DNA_END=361 /DNA_ORIENTATION=-